MKKPQFYYLLHPRPVVIIGSGSFEKGKINFFACSWITPIDDEEKLLGISCWKGNYSYQLIKSFKKFSVNVVEDIDLIWKVGSVSGKNVDKVKEFGIEIFKGKHDLPLIKNSLAFLECEVVKEVEFQETSFFISKVLNYNGRLDEYGLKEFWKMPLHKAGKAFVYPSRELKYTKEI